MVNKILLAGRIQHTPEVKYLPNGRACLNFTLDVYEKRGDEYRHDYFDCTAYGKTAEAMGTYLTKGDSVFVFGSIHARKYASRKWKNAETGEPAMVTTWDVTVDGFNFIGKRNERQQEEPATGLYDPFADSPQTTVDAYPDIQDPFSDE